MTLLDELQTLIGFSFLVKFSFCSGINTESHVAFSCHVPLVTSKLTISVLMPCVALICLKSTDEVFCRVSLDLDFSVFSEEH